RGGRVVGGGGGRGGIAGGGVGCWAGGGAGGVGGTAGVELPVEGERRWMFFTPEDGGLPERVPLTIDFSSGFYFHREGPGLVFGGREQTAEELAEPASRRLPLLLDLPVQSSWWGYYEVRPGHNAIVGEAAGQRR